MSIGDAKCLKVLARLCGAAAVVVGTGWAEASSRLTLVTCELEDAAPGFVRRGQAYGVRISTSTVESVEFSSVSVAGAGETVVETARLERDDGSKRDLRAVLWLDPQYFSIASDREGLFDPGVGVQLRRRTVDNVMVPAMLHVREKAPDGFTDIGVLLLADHEYIGEIVITTYVAAGTPDVRRDEATISPFKGGQAAASLTPDAAKRAVLTLIEVRERITQVILFAENRYVTWRIALPGRLADWALRVDRQLNDSNITAETVAADVRAQLFPEDDACKSENCGAARKYFDVFLKFALQEHAEVSPLLLVQALPVGQDEFYSPVAVPLGMYPLEGIEQTRSATQQPVRQERSEVASDPEDVNLDPEGVASPTAAVPRVFNPSTGEGPAADPSELTADDLAPLTSDALSDRYLAYKFAMYSPVFRRRSPRRAGHACAHTWSIYVPPRFKATGSDGALLDARSEIDVLVENWLKPRAEDRTRLLVAQNLKPLSLAKSLVSDGLLLLSHFDKESMTVRLEQPGGPESLGVGQLIQQFHAPAVALLLACETAVPAENAFVAKLIQHGASTLITTTSRVRGKVAGEFAHKFLMVLRRKGVDGASVGEVFAEAWREMSVESRVFRPRFVIMGDLTVRICAPL